MVSYTDPLDLHIGIKLNYWIFNSVVLWVKSQVIEQLYG